MKRKKIQYNEINDEIYTQNSLSKIKIFTTCIILFLIGFLLNFNFEERLNNILKPLMANNQSCPIYYDKLEISFFMPKIQLKKPIILGNCFGQPANNLPLTQMTIALSGPSFVPPGIKLNFTATEGKTKINILPSLSFSKHVIELRDSTLDAERLGVLFSDGKSPFMGTINLDGVFHIESNKLTEGKFEFTSKNLILPAQNIKSFVVPEIKLKTLSLKGKISKETNLDIREFKLGNGNPLGIYLRGKINLNKEYFSQSQANLIGTLKVTPFFLENFALLKLFLPPNPNPNGEFKMVLAGDMNQLTQPQLSNP